MLLVSCLDWCPMRSDCIALSPSLSPAAYPKENTARCITPLPSPLSTGSLPFCTMVHLDTASAVPQKLLLTCPAAAHQLCSVQTIKVICHSLACKYISKEVRASALVERVHSKIVHLWICSLSCRVAYGTIIFSFTVVIIYIKSLLFK